MSTNKSNPLSFQLDFFPDHRFETNTPDNPEEHNRMVARNIFRLLMMGWQNPANLLSVNTIKAILIEHSPELSCAMRYAFQQGFTHIYAQLQTQNLNRSELDQTQFFLSNCLTILPYLDITPYESFDIPQYIDGSWQLVAYKVTPIELTPTTGYLSLHIHEEQRVFAYGLEPIAHPSAQAHLMFKGTTYPADYGYLTQIFADLTPFETAGESLYQTGQANITAWLDRQPQKPHVCGSSLGGSLALLLAIHQGEKLSRVDALNPPGLFDSWRKSPFDLWDKCPSKPPVYIQKQANDPVSCFGVWKDDWHIIQVNPPVDKAAPLSTIDHTLNYAGLAGTTFEEVSTTIDNQNRKVRTIVIDILRTLIYYPVMVPYFYIMHPILYYISHHKTQVSLFCASMALFFIFPAWVIPLTATPWILNTTISAAIITTVMSTIIQYLDDKIKGKQDSNMSHVMDWFDKQSTFAKTFFAIGLVALLMMPPLILGLTPTSVIGYVWLSLPLIALLSYNTIQAIKTILHLKEAPTPRCHDQTLLRNPSLDVYTNHIEITVTKHAIKRYPSATDQMIVISDSDHMMTLRGSKADIYNTTQIIKGIAQFGLYPPKQLKDPIIAPSNDISVEKLRDNDVFAGSILA